jgi:hypothetical protein
MKINLAQDCPAAVVDALANASLPIVIGPEGQCRINNDVRDGLPKVVVISVPKSGTHFTGELLVELGFRFAGLHLSPESLPDTLEDRRRLVQERLSSPSQKRHCIPLKYSVPLSVVAELIGPGQYLQGHVPYSETAAEGLREMRIVYVERNPRDLAISSMRFIERLYGNGHRFEDFLRTDWIPMENGPEKIIGYLDSFGRGVPKLLSEISPWRLEPNSFTLQFDTIVTGEPSGLAAIRNLAAFLYISVDDAQAQSIRDACVGRPTTTWSGKLSDWREVWSDDVEAKFEEIGGAAFADPDSLRQP